MKCGVTGVKSYKETLIQLSYLVQLATIHDDAHRITDVLPPAPHLHTVLKEVTPLNLAHIVTSHQCAVGHMERNPVTEWGAD